MTGSEAVQLVGTAAIALLAVGLLLIAAEARRFSRYGREALIVAGSYMLVAAAVRMLVLTEMITQTNGREVNGLLAWVALVVLGQVVYLQRRERHALDRCANERSVRCSDTSSGSS